MRASDVKYIVVHCSATKPGQWVDAELINRMHRAAPRSFHEIGYHHVICPTGKIEAGRMIAFNTVAQGAHVRGYNAQSVGICIAGGLRSDGTPFEGIENYSLDQIHSLRVLVATYTRMFPDARVCGHRDLSPDRDGDGIVEPHEWLKACPCFDAAAWWERERSRVFA